MKSSDVTLAPQIDGAVTSIRRGTQVRIPRAFRRQPFIIALGSLLLAATSFIPSPLALCWEGGVKFGFPFPYFRQCYEGGPPLFSPAEWTVAGLIADMVVWYLVACAIVVTYRNRARSSNEKRFPLPPH